MSNGTGPAPTPNPTPAPIVRTPGQAGPTRANAIHLKTKPIVLEIADRKTGNAVSGIAQTVIVGQRVQLGVRSKPAAAISNIRWTVPGDEHQRVKDYTQSASLGTRVDLATGDLQAVNLDFFWIAGGNQTVQVTATVGGATLTAQVTYQVLAPTNVAMTSITGDVGVGSTGFDGDPPLNLYYGIRSKVGIQWTCTATAPAGGDGKIAATQLSIDDREKMDNSGSRYSHDSGGVFVLDTVVPYDTPVDIAAGASATWTSNDSPSTDLTDDLRWKSINNSFRTYFMYKPAGDSIWVTLMRLDWHFAGLTTRVASPAGNVWYPPTSVVSDKNPSGVASTELPTWKDNYTSIGWK